MVSRPCIFTVLNLNEVVGSLKYMLLPHIDIELMNSEYISAGLSWVTPGANEECLAI